MEKVRDEILLDAMGTVLQRNCNRSEYSIHGEKDSAICLDDSGGCWLVYSSERGSRWDEQSFGTLMEACLEMLNRMGQTPDEANKMKNEFLDAVIIKQR